jgi:hypothetical protein
LDIKYESIIGSVVKKMLESKPEGRRSIERPKLRWLEDAEKDLLEMMVKSGDRQQWTEKNGLM